MTITNLTDSNPTGDPPSQHHFLGLGRVQLAVLLVLGLYSLRYLLSRGKGVNAPVIGSRGFWEPTWLLRLRFIRGSRGIIKDGYQQFKDSMFKVRRVGTDVLVVSSKYMDEIRTLTRDSTGSVPPLVLQDLPGEYTSGMPFLRSDLQNRVLQQKLTPSLHSFTAVMVNEMKYSIGKEMPACTEDEWTKVDIVPIISRLITCLTSIIFIGPEDGKNEEWLATTVEYTQNLFLTGMALRVVPRLLRPLVAPLLPCYHHLNRNVATSRRIVGSLVCERRLLEAQDSADYKKPMDILQWMMDMAVGQEAEPEDLAQRMLILGVTSIHTTTLTLTQALYDLIAHPEFLDPVRQEITDVLQANNGWGRPSFGQQRKIDSLLKESQRFSPIFLMTFNRLTPKPITLSNGTFLPAGTRIAVPSNAMLQDPTKVPGCDPSIFDAFRYSRLREDPAHPENAQRHLFAMTDPHNVAFGYGKFACPGRFYASNEMKIILAFLLTLYDFRFLDGCGRPKNFTIDSDLYPDPSTRILIRRRGVDEATEELLARIPEHVDTSSA